MRLRRREEMGRCLIRRGERRGTDQDGNRGTVENEWRKSMGMDEDRKRRKRRYRRHRLPRKRRKNAYAEGGLSSKNRVRLRRVHRSVGDVFVFKHWICRVNVVKRSCVGLVEGWGTLNALCGVSRSPIRRNKRANCHSGPSYVAIELIFTMVIPQ
jgi:hypothetical protein